MFLIIMRSKRNTSFRYASLNFGNLVFSEISECQRTYFGIVSNSEDAILHFRKPSY